MENFQRNYTKIYFEEMIPKIGVFPKAGVFLGVESDKITNKIIQGWA